MSRMVHVRATQDMGDFPDREALIDHSQVGGWAAAMHDLGYALVEVRPIEDRPIPSMSDAMRDAWDNQPKVDPNRRVLDDSRTTVDGEQP